MQLCGHMDEYDDCDEECSVEDGLQSVTLEVNQATRDEWAHKPIGGLPSLALVFQGERSSAKAMAKELAVLWEIPEKVEMGVEAMHEVDDKRRSKNKVKGLRQYRRRGGGHRQAFGY